MEIHFARSIDFFIRTFPELPLHTLWFYSSSASNYASSAAAAQNER